MIFNEEGLEFEFGLVSELIGIEMEFTPTLADTAWDYLYMAFVSICDKHAPVKKFRIIGRDNPWVSDNLAELIRKRNISWAQARHTNAPFDWASFRGLRNKCTGLIRKSKSDYCLNAVTENLNNPTKFWKPIKSVSGSNVSSGLPDHVIDSNEVKDKAHIVGFFNKHFISAGSVFDNGGAQASNVSSVTVNYDIGLM